MRMFGLTDLGHVLKLEVTDGESPKKARTKIIQDAIVLDTDKATFSLEYSPNKYGDLVTETISDNPKDIYDRISKARVELDKRELALMTHLFILEKDDYTLSELQSEPLPKPRPKRPRTKKDVPASTNLADGQD